MFLAVLTVDIVIPGSASLKDKRVVIKSIKDRVRKKINVSVAEVDYQDKWQRSTLAFATVASNKKVAQETLNNVFNNLDNDFNFEIIKHSFDFR